jgi:hypothetical protein
MEELERPMLLAVLTILWLVAVVEVVILLVDQDRREAVMVETTTTQEARLMKIRDQAEVVAVEVMDRI